VLDPGARHPHRFCSEGAGELPFAVPVAIAFRQAVAPAVAKAAEKSGRLFFENGLDGRADADSEPLLYRVEPDLSGR
jgi:hypothetical protein